MPLRHISYDIYWNTETNYLGKNLIGSGVIGDILKQTKLSINSTVNCNKINQTGKSQEEQMILSFTILSSLLFLAQSEPLVREDWPSFDVVCHESEDGYAVFAPHPYDCGLYYECVGETPVLMTCPGDLEFDIQLNVCNSPELANCQPRTTTTTTATTTTETTTVSMIIMIK